MPRKRTLRTLTYRETFFAHNGPGPYSCSFCEQLVYFERVIVHHLDHNRSNNDPSNLAPAHEECHSSHHSTGRSPSPQTRAKLSLASTGRVTSPETRTKLSEAVRIYNQKREFTVAHIRWHVNRGLPCKCLNGGRTRSLEETL